MNTKIGFAVTDEEIDGCFAAMQALRPHITDPGAFCRQVQEMKKEGYRLLYIAVQEKGQQQVTAVAGFRPMYKLHSGRGFYIDDLSTLPGHRGKGYAGQLLDYIHRLAKEEGKAVVDLDSGFQRHDAHRLYLNKGYLLATHHFSFRVPE